MNKFIAFASFASLIALASCSADEPLNGNVADGTAVDVKFSAVLENNATRAYGDGTTAKDLYYAVYDKDGNYLFEEKTEFPAGSLHKDVSIQLVTGETYQIVFWAQSADASIYEFDAEAKTMTATYPTDNNAETLDAFYVAKTLTVSAADLNQTAELKRPLCQVNIATADSAYVVKSGVAFPTESAVTFTDVPNVLNLLDGTVAGSAEVTFSQATRPEGKITVNGNQYEYLSMTYFLAPSEGDVQTTVTMNVNNFTDGKRAYNNIPVKRNYRTNIVGDLLTSTTLWDVYINPIFETPDYDIIYKDGVAYQNIDGELHRVVASTDDLKAALANNENVSLASDITVPEGDTEIPSYHFYAFDGDDKKMELNGHTLSMGSKFLAAAQSGKLKLSNGTIETTNRNNALQVQDNAHLELDGVVIKGASIMSGVVVVGNSSLVVNNSIITSANGYAINTNATNLADQPTVTITNSTLTGFVGVLYNLNSNLTIENSHITGALEALIVRGGKATITNSTLTQTYGQNHTEAECQEQANLYNDKNWASGSFVTLGALVMGNKSTAYQYPTNVTMSNTTVEVLGTYGSYFPAVYAYANQGDGLGVTFTYDDACKFIGGKGLVYGSKNITVNGVAQ